MLTFLTPQLAGLRSGQVDRQGIAFLQQNTGLARFYTTGPFAPNFPAMYDIASLNIVQIPAPKRFIDYVESQVFPGGDIFIFLGGQPGQIPALQKNLAAYEALGVKYVGADPGVNPFQTTIPLPSGPPANQYIALQASQSLSGTIPLPPGNIIPSLAGITVTLGTFGGPNAGSVTIQLCQQTQCTTGATTLPATAYDGPFTIRFDHPFTPTPGQPLTYRFTHPSGGLTAIWLASDLGASQHLIPPPGSPAPAVLAPVLTLQRTIAGTAPTLAFHSPAMDIYQLPNPAPYAQITTGTCTLAILSRQKMQATCTTPATLTRRELFDPGWQATINGTPTPIHAKAGIFQKIPLPTGTSVIGFTYLPPHTHLSCTLALLALSLWLGCWLSVRRKVRSGGAAP